MDWVECKSVWVVGPEFAVSFVGCEAPKGLESQSEVVGCDEVRQVRFELFVGVIEEEAFDGGKRLAAGPMKFAADCSSLLRDAKLGEELSENAWEKFLQMDMGVNWRCSIRSGYSMPATGAWG